MKKLMIFKSGWKRLLSLPMLIFSQVVPFPNFSPVKPMLTKYSINRFSQKVHLLQRLLPFGIFNCLNKLCRENLLKLLFSLFQKNNQQFQLSKTVANILNLLKVSQNASGLRKIVSGGVYHFRTSYTKYDNPDPRVVA